MGKADTGKTTLSFMGSGRYSDVFKVSSGRHTVVMKVSYYRDNTLCDFVSKLRHGDHEGARAVKNKDSIMVSAAFANVTNSLVSKRASPHFVFVYCHADCRNLSVKLAPLLKNRLKTSTKVQLKYNNACFMELMSGDMTGWLRSSQRTVTDANVRKAIFEVVYTLGILQKAYPGFRHNDLSTNNVLISKKRSTMKLGYVFDGVSYYAPTTVFAAISDYDFTHVPNHAGLANERVVGGKYRVTETPNPTYDTHFFLKSVLKSASKKATVLRATLAFLKSLPLQAADRLDTTTIPGLDPAALLKHAYFDPLRVAKMPAGAEVYGDTALT
jgi:hypothetical protein